MDPYYQQQAGQMSQQQQVAASSRNDTSQLMGGPSAPTIQSSGHHQQPPVPHLSGGHRSHSSQLQQQQVQQQQQPAQYVDSYPTQQQQQQQQQQQSSSGRLANGLGHHGGGSHHHGGQPVLPPNQQHGSTSASAHHSAGRYAGDRSHRSTLHQHRSSAAAISDPMMAGTITDQLASASGPLTGSGSALNQLGMYSAQNQQQQQQFYRDLTAERYPNEQALGGYLPGAASQQQQQQLAHSAGAGHQSRYDSHYPSGSRSGRINQQQHQLVAGQTTLGAYHLERGQLDPLTGEPLTSRAQHHNLDGLRRGDLDYYPQQTAVHQSLGNLPSAINHQRYALDRDRYYGPAESMRAGSMPPAMETSSLGLGAYNPLDDPLMMGTTNSLHHHRHNEQQQLQQSYYGQQQQNVARGGQEAYVTELRARLLEAQNSYANVKRELETATQKLGSSMHSIKSFWSPELKKERALRKEEATKYALINDQMKLMRVEVQKQALLIRQLEEELRLAHETRIRTTDPDIQQHIDALCMEKESLFKENCMLRETVRELEMRIETQKQTLAARDDSIKKMVEMMNNKGIATKILEDERLEIDRVKTRNIELEARLRHYETIIEAKEKDIIKINHPKQVVVEQQQKQFKTTSLEFEQNNFPDNFHLLPPKTKSPIPMERKSLLSTTNNNNNKQATSKVQRLKNRLASSRCPPPSKEKLNEMLLQSSTSSSSSGFSSSKSSTVGREEMSNSIEEIVGGRADNESRVDESNYGNIINHYDKVPQESYKLCQCLECQFSGQEIYSLNQKMMQMRSNVSLNQFKTTTNNLSILQPRKAVSFRSNVEHIGSPSFRPLNDVHLNYQFPTSRLHDSCDSMHVTKDFSLNEMESQLMNSDDYLRPIDCSTPKQSSNFANNCSKQQQQVATNGEQLVHVEVHKAPVKIATNSIPTRNIFQSDYTCLCSPDFNCIHNNPQLANLQQLRISEENSRDLSGSQRTTSKSLQSINNELYGTTAAAAVATTSGDFPLSKDCIECKNLSTYVNLSRNSNNYVQQLADSSVASSSNGLDGYGKIEYKQLIKSKQNDIYGKWNSAPLIPVNRNQMLDEQLHYLSAARRLQQSIVDNCEICNSESLQNKSNPEPQCHCQPSTNVQLVADNNNPGLIITKQQQQQQPSQHLTFLHENLQQATTNGLDLSTSKSYHTANSSSIALNESLLQDCTQQHRDQATQLAMLNASELSVLPIAETLNRSVLQNSTRQNESSVNLGSNGPGFMVDSSNKSTNCNNSNNNNIDSSLSSLFVYRHASDDNQASNEFDPDSLEISKLHYQEPPKRGCSKVSDQNSCWLKGRPKSEYISLSSTTSSISALRIANTTTTANDTTTRGATTSCPKNKNKKSMNENSNGTKSLLRVDSDLTQSSLAKRRHLNKNIQQQQQQQPSNSKKKLMASKANSKSSSNISNQQSNNTSRSNNSSNSNVKNIYQCFKNHLLDITKSSNSSSSSVSNPRQMNLIGSSATLPNNLSISVAGNKSRNKSNVQMEELRSELGKREQETLTMNAKMKALEDQQRDSQRHIRVLKDSLVAKEEHYNLLLADVEELKRNLDERNKMIEKKSFQQNSLRGGPLANMSKTIGVGQYNANYQELQEMQELLELRDKKIGDLQRKVLQLDGLLAERDAQLDRARIRLEHSTHSSSGANNSDLGLLNHLEESLNDKEKQISLLRDQRDRAEHELNEERDSHERSIKEYKMKLNSLKFEMDKLQNRFNKTNSIENKYGEFSSSTNDRFMGADQLSLIKRLELDKRSLQLECERLRDKLDLTQSLSQRRTGQQATSSIERASSALGDYSVTEFERLQEQLETQKQELRRAQAECRMNEMERKRAQEEADKLSERYERTQGEMHKLKAKLENATSEREQLIEEYERQQHLINKSQTERDSALADINQLKMENERLQQNFNKNQLQMEKLQGQLERTQLECKKLEDRFNEASDELRRLQQEKATSQRELKTIEMELQSSQLQLQRLQQEKDLNRVDLEKIRDKYERLELETERYLHDKDLNQQQVNMYKERIESHQQQITKWTKEREQMSMEIQELRERLSRQQKLQDTSEHETRNEVRIWKEKYERLVVQFEKLNEDLLGKQKESQMVMDKLQRVQSEAVKLETKLEQSEMDRERLVIEVEKLQQYSNKVKEDYKRWQDELAKLQEMYTKTNTKLLKANEAEEKLRIDHDKCQMDLEVLRERYEKLQLESRKLQAERDRLQVEHERIRFDNERIQQSQGTNQATQDDFIRMSSELDRSVAKLEQYQREINKLKLEKERLILDSKSSVQQTEQQYQQQLLKLKSSEEKLTMELERTRLQLDKVQSKYDQFNVDQEKLVADKERLQQQLLLLQQEVDKFRNQQSTSVQETKKLHDDEMQRILQELETIREKYTQQRKELLQLRELQQNQDIDKDILKKELESAETRLEKLNQTDSKQKQESERCLIELEKMKDKIDRKQQELARAQKERNQFAQEITNLHQQIQQLQLQLEKQQSSTQSQSQQLQHTQQQPQAQPQQVKMEEVNKLKQMLLKSENDLQKTMAENQRFQMEVERLKLQMDDAAEYIGKIENDNKMIQRQNQEIIQQLQHQQQQLQQQGSGQQRSGNQPQELERAQQEMKKMQDVIKKSANEIQKMVEERNKLQESNKELQKDLEQTRSQFNSTIEQYEAELKRLQQEIQQAKQQQPNKQNVGDQQQQPANDEYKVKFEKAVEAIKAFQKTSEEMKKEIIKLNKSNKSLLDQNQALIQSLKLAEENLQKMQTSQDGKSSDKQFNNEIEQGLKQQVAQLGELCNKLEKDLNSSLDEVKKNQQANQQLRQALDKSQSEMNNLKTERDRFQTQLEKIVVELERREADIQKLRSQQEKSGQDLQSKQNELVSYQQQLEEREKVLEAKRLELQKQVEQQNQQKPNAGDGSNQQQELVQKLQQQVKALEEERVKLKGELERVRNELKQTQAELERLLKILQSSEEDKFNLTQQLDQLQAKLKSIPQGAQLQRQQQSPQQPAASGQQQAAASQQRPQATAEQRPQAQQPPQRQPQQPPRAGQPQPPQQQQPNQQRPTNLQQPRPAGQNQPLSEDSFNTSIQDNMELLELALKHSMNWSIRSRPLSGKRRISEHRLSLDCIKSDIQDESHIRAFITQFKIELNNLMDIKRMKTNDQCQEGEEEAWSDRDSLGPDDNEDGPAIVRVRCTLDGQENGQTRKSQPIIQINGKYSGLYDLNEQLDDNDVEQDIRAQQAHQQVSINNDTCISTCADEDDFDDGYRSLSRSSFKSNLMQQLSDIKSRLIDLVHEIDVCIKLRLSEEEVEAYRRRRDALIAKLDYLMDSCLGKVNDLPPISNSTPSDSTGNNIINSPDSSITTSTSSSLICHALPVRTITKNRSETNLLSDGYEEQEQVINYDYRRRCSEATGLNTDSNNMRMRPIDNRAVSSNQLEKRPIDFGAMMRNFETSQKEEVTSSSGRGTNNKKINGPIKHTNVQHVPSSSSTSSYSISSHTSSSSFL